jgi:hypothetical protein
MLSPVPTLKDEKIRTHKSCVQKIKLELKMSGNPRAKENKASIWESHLLNRQTLIRKEKEKAALNHPRAAPPFKKEEEVQNAQNAQNASSVLWYGW